MIWWNTSLSPTAKAGRSTQADQNIAFGMIDLFTKNLLIDVICLGEMSADDVVAMRNACSVSEYAIYEGFSRAGRSAFDVCILYRKNILLLLDNKEVVSFSGKNSLKIGQRIDFALADNETVIHVFVSHWPSRLWCDEHHTDRHRLGMRLRDAVDEVLGEDHTAHVVVMGDFNDDPFAPSLEDHLKATRDRDLASRKRHFMYNPFWRHMGSNALYSADVSDPPSYGGSYYYKSGRLTRWHTFDQIIFSSSFLGNSDWHLREDAVKVVDVPSYTDLVRDHDESFDHMPVFALIEKVN
ncbi:endonuclease/exonuclease/phosphatase family protein [Burkholderia vietnamiensis]|uniref:endonuclease/exonuclease/phosphatase family protein n=1 Tax=Burkholderia vietnamiensis TaxID=60552 RepID=UPI002DD441BE|nr:endonuclease/exonuclease/phosphatase family protein [Burkholderia vietnamiensis]MEC4599257.1 endonuclease/exonuclease/phosphatase family protein [Burkholderia vietnamiensis]